MRQNESTVDDSTQAEGTLAGLRRLLALTQQELAHRLGKGQEEISRIEKRTDLRLSTLQRYVAALGGELELTCRFKDRPSVRLSTLAGQSVQPPPQRRLVPRLPGLITRGGEAIVSLCRRHGVRRLSVFGAVLRADFNPHSSGIDVAVEFEGAALSSSVSPHPALHAALQGLFGQAVNLLDMKSVDRASQISLYESP